ncbi:MAG: EAL domain-containing protein [Thermomicrobiales bacterium]|nr:EAL domain-containing protein [Thermomicrobiales bacterium]
MRTGTDDKRATGDPGDRAVAPVASASPALAAAAAIRTLQSRALDLLAAGAEPDAVLTVLCEILNATLGDAHCAVLLLGDDGRLRHAAAANLPAAYLATLDGLLPEAGADGRGPTALPGALMVAADIATDPQWAGGAEAALAHGLRACWSAPIREPASGIVVGKLVVYRTMPGAPDAGERGVLGGAASLASVIARLGRLADERRVAEARYRTLVEQAPAVVYIERLGDRTDAFISAQVEALLGYSPADLIAGTPTWDDLIHPADRLRVQIAVRQSDETGDPFDEEYRMLGRDGRVVWVRNQAVLVRGGAGQPLFWHGIAIDLTERKHAEDRLAYLAHHDALTGLPNRALFAERLAAAVERAGRRETSVAVLFIDLDGFKNLNDTLGHDAGDRVLVEVGARLRGRLRPVDTLARFGGDEFVVLLESAGGEPIATHVADRLLGALRPPLTVDGFAAHLSASIGIAVLDDASTSPSDLLRQADIALYEAKAAGRSTRTVFAPSMSRPVVARLRWEADLRRAVDNGELMLHYQPEVALASRRITRFEALVRWNHPEHGLLLPERFIRLAEDTGLIVPLGRWVLREACRQARAWKEAAGATPPFQVSVNLSGREFHQSNLASEAAKALTETGLDPRLLGLDVTETDAVEAPDAIRRLRALGARVALDDFGAASSSLAALRDLEVDALKLHRSLVTGLERDRRSAAIVRAVAALGHELELEVVAKGIETARQAEALRQLEVDYGQGFGFAPPMRAAEIDLLLTRATLAPGVAASAAQPTEIVLSVS